MKSTTIAVGLVLVLSVPGRAADEKDLNGTWIPVAATNRGEKVPDDFFKGSKLVFSDGKYTATLGELVEDGTYTVDRSKKPNAVDMVAAGGKKVPPKASIFVLDGDTLTICTSFGKNPPRDLTSTAENKNFVVVYKRGK